MYVDFIPLSFVSTCSSAEEERAMAIFGMRCFSSKKMALLCFFFFFFVAAVQVRAQTTGRTEANQEMIRSAACILSASHLSVILT